LQAQVKKNQVSIEALNDIIIDSIQDIKGKNIVKFDLRNLTESPADFFILCEGESNTQVSSIADRVFKRVREEAATVPSNREGYSAATWVCMDYFNTVVHVFHKDARKFYQLDELWNDAEITAYDSL